MPLTIETSVSSAMLKDEKVVASYMPIDVARRLLDMSRAEVSDLIVAEVRAFVRKTNVRALSDDARLIVELQYGIRIEVRDGGSNAAG